MPLPITGIGQAAEISNIRIEQTKDAAAPGFGAELMKMMKQTNTEMATADEAARAFSAGETSNIHEVMLATEKALIAFKLVGSVRNRMVDAYNEIMRMPL